MADPSVVGVNVSQPVCDGTCSLSSANQSDTQQIDTQRCAAININSTLATNTGKFHITKLCRYVAILDLI